MCTFGVACMRFVQSQPRSDRIPILTVNGYNRRTQYAVQHAREAMAQGYHQRTSYVLPVSEAYLAIEFLLYGSPLDCVHVLLVVAACSSSC